jgi:hypothetical protein
MIAGIGIKMRGEGKPLMIMVQKTVIQINASHVTTVR